MQKWHKYDFWKNLHSGIKRNPTYDFWLFSLKWSLKVYDFLHDSRWQWGALIEYCDKSEHYTAQWHLRDGNTPLSGLIHVNLKPTSSYEENFRKTFCWCHISILTYGVTCDVILLYFTNFTTSSPLWTTRLDFYEIFMRSKVVQHAQFLITCLFFDLWRHFWHYFALFH